jgi:4-amino-4-deoxy-L-arabinose transferase-like glycosyltransferase
MLALAARLVFFGAIYKTGGELGFYRTANGDAEEYFNLAKNMLAGNGFSKFAAPPYAPDAFRTPGYPAFIAFFYLLIPSAAWVAFWQNIFFLAFIFLFYNFIKKQFDAIIAFWGAVFLSFDPNVIYINNQLMSESVFCILLFLSVYFSALAMRRSVWLAALSGLAAAAAIYVRPIGSYILAVFALFYVAAFVLNKISLRRAAACLLIFASIFFPAIYPWQARNKRLFGTAEFSTAAVASFVKYYVAMAKVTGDDASWVGDTHYNNFDYVTKIKNAALSFAMQHPLAFGRVYAFSLVPFFGGDGLAPALNVFTFSPLQIRQSGLWHGQGAELVDFVSGRQGISGIIFWFGKFGRIAIMISAVSGFFMLWRGNKERHLLVWFLLLIVYFSLASGPGSYSRFRFPVEPYLYFFATGGIGGFTKLFKKSV